MYLASALLAVINAITFLLIVAIPQLSQNDNTIRLMGVWNLFVTLAYFSLAGGLATKQRRSYDAGITLGIANAIFIMLQATQVGQTNSSGVLILIALDLIMVVSIYIGKQTSLPTQAKPPISAPEEERVETAVAEKTITEEEGRFLLEIRDAYARDKKALRDQIVSGVRVDIAYRYGVMDQQRWEYYSFVPIATPEVMKRLFIHSRIQFSGSSVHYLIATDITPDAYAAIPGSVGGVYVLRKREKLIRLSPSGQFEMWLARNYNIAFLPVEASAAAAMPLKTGEEEIFEGNIQRGCGRSVIGGGFLLALGGGSLYAVVFADQFWVKLAALTTALLSLIFFVLTVASMFAILKLELIITESGIQWKTYDLFRRAVITASWQEIESIKTIGGFYYIHVRKDGKLHQIDLNIVNHSERILAIVRQRAGAKVEPL